MSKTIKCEICGKYVANSRNVLGRHVRREHDLDFPAYVVKYELGGEWPRCACGCGFKLTYRKGGFGKFLKGHNVRGKNNPMYGKRGEDSPIYGIKRTAEQIENYRRGAHKRWEKHGDQLREMMQTDEYRETMRQSILRSNIDGEHSKRVSTGMKRWWAENPEMRERFRDRALQLLEEGKIGPQAPYKAEWITNPFNGEDEYMHSGWETRFLIENVEKENPVIKNHGIRIAYTAEDGNIHVYVPDFLGCEDETLYEIKGQTDGNDELKWIAAQKWCSKHPEVAQHFRVVDYY